MDSFEIVSAIIGGAILEIYQATKTDPDARAFLDEVPVSITQAMRASNSPLVKVVSTASNWSAYSAA